MRRGFEETPFASNLYVELQVTDSPSGLKESSMTESIGANRPFSLIQNVSSPERYVHPVEDTMDTHTIKVTNLVGLFQVFFMFVGMSLSILSFENGWKAITV